MTEEAQASRSPAEEIGDVFRAAREKAGATRDQVADALHLDVSAIAAIEEGRFEALPMRPYARGYVRNYARLLGIDADDLVERFDAADVGRPEPAATVPRHAVARRSEMALRPIAVGYSAIVAVLIAAVAAVLWTSWRLHDWQFPFLSGAPDPVPAAPPAAESPVRPPDVSPWPRVEPSASIDDASRRIADEAEADEAGPGDADIVDAPPAEPPPPGSAFSPDASVADAAMSVGGLGELTVVFDDESWLSVDDAAGRQLFGDLGEPGRTITVAGEKPFRILVGNAPAVRIEFEGETVDLGAHTSSENVARLEVGG